MLPARLSAARAGSVITITGAGDHDQPDWLTTMTGIRNLKWVYPRSMAFPVSVGML